MTPSPFRLFPERASSMAAPVDHLFLFLCLLTFCISLGVAVCLIYFALRYRRKDALSKGAPIEGSLTLELTWSTIPMLIFVLIFYWGAKLYVALATPPQDALQVYVVAKQWMWKFQHLGGQTEMGELHIPIGRDIKLTLATEDVIHSFFVPAFRIKTDIVPGRYRTVWFRALRPGAYHLFCAEFCGTNHSGMLGAIIALPEAEYQNWLQGGKTTGSSAAEGEKLFAQLGCNTCHLSERQGRAPVLFGLYGKPVPLRDGRTVIADDSYLRESILVPAAKIVAGFEPIMPSFTGLLREEQVLLLLAYIQSLGGEQPAPAATHPELELR
jgi:cytochrome c oxidase subunit 2